MNDSICPAEVVSSSGSGDLVGDCAIVSSASSSGLKGGICQDTFFRPAKVANFICQKQKEEFYIDTTTTESTTTSNILLKILKVYQEKKYLFDMELRFDYFNISAPKSSTDASQATKSESRISRSTSGTLYYFSFLFVSSE